ncbi:hypothetical protein HZ326_20002 [Fusarium oxysporum f. sp. albedinis]|nr:hypothetical protein HZ326_20002 [Fusarium oxysporum f. sp. albedinis]
MNFQPESLGRNSSLQRTLTRFIYFLSFCRSSNLRYGKLPSMQFRGALVFTSIWYSASIVFPVSPGLLYA